MLSTGWNAEMALGIAGLVIGIVGLAGLISLWPSLSIEPLAPIDSKQPFSVPFKVTNSGYLPIKDLEPFCYVHSVKVGGHTFTANLMTNKNWATAHLERGESITIVSNFIHSDVMPAEADIAIAVDYKPWGMPFKTMRAVSRFVGHFGLTWQWFKQASKPIRQDVDKSIAGYKGWRHG
jgi:hypothetical protein